jgi:hypothetical protein
MVNFLANILVGLCMILFLSYFLAWVITFLSVPFLNTLPYEQRVNLCEFILVTICVGNKLSQELQK